jgi:hypothetical protein
MLDLTPLVIVIALLALDVLALYFGSDGRHFDLRHRQQPSL